MKSTVNLADIGGLIRLILEQAGLITRLVEDLHTTIARPFSFGLVTPQERAPGITGLVYRSIHGCYQLVGAGVEGILNLINPLFDVPESTPEREAMLALVNGIWGDYLAASHNPLAIDLSLRSGGKPINLQKTAIQGIVPPVSGKIALLVHGLCMNDLQWSRSELDYNKALADDFGYTVIHLHYNSGLHISQNGRRMAEVLEALIQEWPQPIEELVIIGHSMGGLVTRSAYHYGTLAGNTWMRHLRRIIFLGTPHHGSSVERVGNWIHNLLKATPYTAPFERLGMMRSAGITDLRYGNLVDEDCDGCDRFADEPDNRYLIPLPDAVQCYAIGVTLGARAGDVKDRLLGDGLVSLDSVLGLHEDSSRCLVFPQSHQWVGYGMSHFDLLNHPEVYQKISQWLAS